MTKRWIKGGIDALHRTQDDREASLRKHLAEREDWLAGKHTPDPYPSGSEKVRGFVFSESEIVATLQALLTGGEPEDVPRVVRVVEQLEESLATLRGVKGRPPNMAATPADWYGRQKKGQLDAIST